MEKKVVIKYGPTNEITFDLSKIAGYDCVDDTLTIYFNNQAEKVIKNTEAKDAYYEIKKFENSNETNLNLELVYFTSQGRSNNEIS